MFVGDEQVVTKGPFNPATNRPKPYPSFHFCMLSTTPTAAAPAAATRKASSSTVVLRKSFSIFTPTLQYNTTCRCAIDVRATTSTTAVKIHLRAWPVGRNVWHCTLANRPHGWPAAGVAVEDLDSCGDGGGVGEENGEEERVFEEKGQRGEKGPDRGVRLSRRQKGGSDIEGNTDLLTIPGVGPKNLRKLVEKGFNGMTELKQFYKDEFLGKANETMVEYLRSSVGIIHRNHAESITTFIKESVDEELKDLSSDARGTSKNRITFCVEGNISVGKTTFLQKIVSDTVGLCDLVEVVPEPIDKWQDVGPEHFNILDAFYANPERYAYTFQNYVFVTRIMQERESSVGLRPLRLMERSIFSDRMVFVRAVHEAKWMNGMEISIYDSWFDPVVSALPGLIPDGFIYLRASPDICHQRMKLRKRAEEGGVSLDYLHDLHERHESWLLPSRSGNHGVFSVTKPSHLDNPLHPDIRDRVLYLQGDHIHSSIQKVPALVLDCEANIDLSRDTEAKQHYARQVAEFFKYVKNMKEVLPPKADQGSHRQIILPREGGLILPNGQHLTDSALKLDFSKAMSWMPGQ